MDKQESDFDGIVVEWATGKQGIIVVLVRVHVSKMVSFDFCGQVLFRSSSILAT